MHCALSPQEDSEDGEIGRRPSEELVSEAEPATEDGEEPFKNSFDCKMFSLFFGAPKLGTPLISDNTFTVS